MRLGPDFWVRLLFLLVVVLFFPLVLRSGGEGEQSEKCKGWLKTWRTTKRREVEKVS